MLAQACEKLGRKARDDCKVEAVEEVTSFVNVQALGRQDVHQAPSITDGSTPPLVDNDTCFCEVPQSICILVIAGWISRQRESRQS